MHDKSQTEKINLTPSCLHALACLAPLSTEKSEFSLTLEDQHPVVKSGCFLWKFVPSFPGNASTKLSWGDQVHPNKLTWFPLILMEITQVYWEIAPSQGCKSHSPDLHP